MAKTSTRASVLRDTLQTSESLAREATLVLEGYSSHLQTLMGSVDRVAARAQTLTTARRNIDGALKQANELLEHLETPKKIQARIKQGPKGGLDAFLSALSHLEECIEFLSRHRGLQTVRESLKLANGLRDEAMLLCYDDFQSNLKRHARFPQCARIAKPLASTLPQEAVSGPSSDDVIPSDVMERLRKLNEAMHRHGNMSGQKVYVEVRTAMLEKMQAASFGKEAPTDDIHRLAWSGVERRIQGWIALNTRMSSHVVGEQQVAHQIFGPVVGQAVFLDIVRPWSLLASQAAGSFAAYKRVPEKAFGLMDMGERMAECMPVFVGVLPDAATQSWQKLLTLFAVEVRLTFAEFQTSLAGDLQCHTVGDGSVHPVAAQTIAYLKRLLTFRSAPAVIFSPSDTLTADVFQPSIQTPAQRQALRDGLEQLLNLLWESLSQIARGCRNKALGALFLMNNAHYQLKSVQTSSSLNAVSQDWQDECENKVEHYGLQYQQAAWDPILAIMRDDPQLVESKMNWMKEKALIKDKWRQMNQALESLIEQQRTWGVPDVVLRANLRDAILEDCLSAYKAFWRKYEVLSFTKSVHKYLRYPPDTLARTVMDDLFESRTGPEDVSHTGSGKARAL